MRRRGCPQHVNDLSLTTSLLLFGGGFSAGTLISMASVSGDHGARVANGSMWLISARSTAPCR